MEVARLLPDDGHEQHHGQLGPKFGCEPVVELQAVAHHLEQQLGQQLYELLDVVLGHWSLGNLHDHREVSLLDERYRIQIRNLETDDSCLNFPQLHRRRRLDPLYPPRMDPNVALPHFGRG
jgi:hypothetical protein